MSFSNEIDHTNANEEIDFGNMPIANAFYKNQIKHNTFNIAGKLSLNEWRGQKNVEFIIDDISVNKIISNTVPSSIG